MAKDGEIKLWDAQKVRLLQTTRKKESVGTPTIINTVHFNSQTGTLLYASNRLFKWKLLIDEETRVSIEQQNSVARDYL